MKTILSVWKKAAIFFLVTFLFAHPAQAQPGASGPTWQEITPRAGSVRAIVAYSAATMYLGTDDGVFRRSGKEWSRASTGLNSFSISSLVVDPQNPLTLYASTNESPGVYKSTDGGAHWALSSSGLSGEVRTLAIHPTNGAVLYAQTASQVYNSTNFGESWQLKSQGIITGENEGDLLSLKIAPSDPAVLYVSEISGHLYRTSDSGETWEKTAPLLGERAWALAIDPSSAATVFAGTFADGVYITSDGGQTWVKRNQGMPNSGNGQMLNAILFDPKHKDTLYASMNANGLYKTTDAGLHWSRLNSVGKYSSPLTLAAHPTAADTILAGYEGSGIYVSPNGGMTWSDLNRGLSRTAIRSLAPDPKNATVVYTGAGPAGLFKTSNRGLIWDPINTGLEFADFPAIAVDPANNRNIYIGGDGGGFYRSADGGRTWIPAFIGEDVVEVYALAVDPASPNIVYAGAFDHGVFKSSDFGKTWSPTGLQGLSAVALALDPVHHNTIYAGADGVWKSTDGGENFQRLNNGLDETCANRLAVDPITPSTVYALACDTGLYKSTSGGEQWEPVPISTSTSGWVSAFALDPQHPNVLYAAADGRLFRSIDAGVSWTAFDDGLPVPWTIDELEVSPVGKGCVFAAGFYTPVLFSTCAPAPAVHRLSRTAATAGETGFTLEVGGLGFTEDAAIRWQGADLPTTFIDDQTLAASVSAAQLASPGETQVEVAILIPGTDPSEPLPFTISPAPDASMPLIYLPVTMK